MVKLLVSGSFGSDSDPKIVPVGGKRGLIPYTQLLPSILKKLWDVYPLNPVHLTRKVYEPYSFKYNIGFRFPMSLICGFQQKRICSC